MISFCKSILDFLRIDLPLTFKNSLLLAAVYTFIIPVIRGISNLDNIHSADVFGQSLALIGVFLFIPIIRQEIGSFRKGDCLYESMVIQKERKHSADMQFLDDYSYDYYIRKYYAASKLQFSIFKICNRDNSVCCFSGDFRTSFFTIRK